MARIAIAGFMHETNTFSPVPTTFESFSHVSEPLSGILFEKEIREFIEKPLNSAFCGFYQQATALGHDVVPLIKIGEAEPSGQLSEELFNHLLGLVLEELAARGPFDGVFLDLHGSLTYYDCQDGEEEILRRVRQLVGDIPIVNSLDMHANINQKSIDYSSAMNGYRTYPHIDIGETGARCAHIMHHLLQGKPLKKAFTSLPFLMPGSAQRTNAEPCKSLYALIDELEQDSDIVSATLATGFLPCDLPHTGPSISVYAVTQEKADAGLSRLYDAVCAREPQFTSDLPDAREGVRQAIALAAQADKPVVIADVQDNPGGGSSSDTTWILHELARQNAPQSALALMYDLEAIDAAWGAGEGAELELDLGGKILPGHQPFHDRFTVEKLFDGTFIAKSPMYLDMEMTLGRVAHLRTGNLHIVCASHRVQALERTFFDVAGIVPEAMKILVVKSTNHYRAAFEPIASHIIPVASPGATFDDPTTAVYRNLREGVRLKGLGPENRRG